MMIEGKIFFVFRLFSFCVVDKISKNKFQLSIVYLWSEVISTNIELKTNVAKILSIKRRSSDNCRQSKLSFFSFLYLFFLIDIDKKKSGKIFFSRRKNVLKQRKKERDDFHVDFFI